MAGLGSLGLDTARLPGLQGLAGLLGAAAAAAPEASPLAAPALGSSGLQGLASLLSAAVPAAAAPPAVASSPAAVAATPAAAAPLPVAGGLQGLASLLGAASPLVSPLPPLQAPARAGAPAAPAGLAAARPAAVRPAPNAAAAAQQQGEVSNAAKLALNLLAGLSKGLPGAQAAAATAGPAAPMAALPAAVASQGPGGPLEAAKIFVGGLPQIADEAVLSAYFSTFGSVKAVEVKRDPLTGNSRGFGFVSFATEEDVRNLLNCGHSHFIGPKQVDVRQARAEEPRHKGDGPAWSSKGHGKATSTSSPSAAAGVFAGVLGNLNGRGSGAALSNPAASQLLTKTMGVITPAMRAALPAGALPPLAAPVTLQKGGSKGSGKGFGGKAEKGLAGKGCGKKVQEMDEAKVFVTGIPKAALEEEVRGYFGQFGAVKRVEMLNDVRPGQFRSYCHVTFEDPFMAQAIQSVPGLELGGQALQLSPAWASGDQPDSASLAEQAAAAAAELEANKIFVGGLLRHTQEEEIKDFFQQFGTVAEVLLKRETGTGVSRGFGFVTFTDEAAMQKAVDNYNSNAVDGKWVDVRRADPGAGAGSYAGPQAPSHAMPALPDGAEGRKLFLGGLAHSVKEEDITQYFSQFGEVTEAVVKRDPEGYSRGFGFLTFAEPEAMERALAQYDSIALGGKWVEVRAAGGYKGHSKGAGTYRSAPY